MIDKPDGDAVPTAPLANEMPLQKSPRGEGGLKDKGPLLARVPNKEVALIRHIAKLEDKHRARVKILNSIEERRLDNTLKQMDFAKVTVGHSIEKQARSFQRSLAVIQQRQKQITNETYHLDHRKLKPPQRPLYYGHHDDDFDDGMGGYRKLPFQMTAPSRSTGGVSLPDGPFSFKDRKREPLGRWIRYPASFRQGHRNQANMSSAFFDRNSSSRATYQSARFSTRFTTRE